MADISGLVKALKDKAVAQYDKGAPYRQALVSALRGDTQGINQALSKSDLTPMDVAMTFAPIGMFAGVKAKGANLGKLAEAKNILANQGADTQAWKQTGWTHGMPDEMPRFEISDVNARSIPSKSSSIGEFSLGDVLNHSELYQNYPHLQGITVKPGKQSGWISNENTITLAPEHYKVETGLNPHYQHQENRVYKLADMLEQSGKWTPEKEARMSNILERINETAGSKVGGIEDKYNFELSPLLHEVQHAVQTHEGFAKGSNPEHQLNLIYSNMLNDIMEKNPNMSQFEAVSLLPKKSEIKQQGWENYWNVPGEVEARLTQSRIPMNSEQRLANYPIRYK